MARLMPRGSVRKKRFDRGNLRDVIDVRIVGLDWSVWRVDGTLEADFPTTLKLATEALGQAVGPVGYENRSTLVARTGLLGYKVRIALQEAAGPWTGFSVVASPVQDFPIALKSGKGLVRGVVE